jgi:hypothetical protein
MGGLWNKNVQVNPYMNQRAGISCLAAQLTTMIATFRYPLHMPFTEHMHIYYCVLLPFPRAAGLGEAAGAGAGFAPISRPRRPRALPQAAQRGGGGGLGLCHWSLRQRLRRRRHRRGCRAEAKAAEVEASRGDDQYVSSGLRADGR